MVERCAETRNRNGAHERRFLYHDCVALTDSVAFAECLVLTAFLQRVYDAFLVRIIL